ncbi:hypothetical protein ABFS82_08G016700 [Erythranthe guttata]|uniref:Cation efflux protein transmembrane domain-containing protein n=1 Tax=Erythranthe guttata TaxID=4155 RepID=A0A022S0D8_ERYGU|nr:PREDICTED: zinc transporter 5 [Erythranthe guttata]XP_012849074.1 PREDICTED: zinc transporter 5 [Erythranthe guttata]EYU44685.1 hypothetical protein MIMGU_mgv1a001493mg [Erythranthe guttata]|eukprot:XP_012849066.1 PREDICTED: zinc transporter 5 [Erythranthe guttata]
MEDHHHHHHRPNRITLPPRSAVPTAATPTPRTYPLFPYPSTPTPTPSKHRFSLAKSSASAGGASSYSFLLLLLFSLRSLYSLLPFLRASPPSFSIFPFSFLVSLLSFLLTLSFSLFSPIFGKVSPYEKSQRPIFSLTSITQSQHKLLAAKSLLLAVIFLLRFQALRYCGTAAMILAELSGNVAARYMGDGKNRNFIGRNPIGSSKVRGFIALFSGLILLSVSWDRIECFPLSHVNIKSRGFLSFPSANCLRIWPMVLPFLSGFLGCYERALSNWGGIRELGQKRVRLITLFFTTVALLLPAVISMFVFEAEGDSISVSSLGWPLANTVVFGVLLSENYTDDKFAASKDIQREYFVTFACTLVLELFYFPELSLWGLLICGFLMWVSVRELNPIYINYPELGFESSEPFSTAVMKPIRHILSERKSRKIALFLLINTAYMVVEFAAGFMSNSLGLISDACHMLFDCAALAIGLYASYISRLPANSQFTYGRGRFEVLSGYVNAVFLVLVGALITLESFERILDPQEISTASLLSVSIGGLAVNIVGLIFFHEEHHHAHGGSSSCSHSHTHVDAHSHSHDHSNSNSHSHSHDHSNSHSHDHSNSHSHDHDHSHGHDHAHNHSHDHAHCNSHSHAHNHSHDDSHGHALSHDHGHGHADKDKKKHQHVDHNMQGIFLHVLADTLGSVGVVISTLLIDYKGWLIADPACSIFISALIVSSVIPLLRNSGEILLQRVPRSCEHDLKGAVSEVMNVKGIFGIQNLRVWSFTNSDIVGTIHLHVSADTDKASVRKRVSHILHDAGIKDLEMQLEYVN